MVLKFRLDKTALAGSTVRQRQCNLACVWCHHDYFAHDGFVAMSNSDYERALVRVIEAALADRADVRIAGDGEPTLSGSELPDLIRRCKSIRQVDRVTLTTNGILLGPMAAGLKAAGVDGVTVSLNSLTSSGYRQYSQHDYLDRVLSSIQLACAAGLPLKVNLIYTRWNQDEVEAFENLSCLFGGLPIKVFDLIPTAGGGELYVPLSRLEDQLRPKTRAITEERMPYAKRIYRLRSGAVFEVKIAGNNNTCPMLACPARPICLEGCRHSIRIGLDGWMHPCGVRTDNGIHLFAAGTTDEDICRALASGGKLHGWTEGFGQARACPPGSTA